MDLKIADIKNEADNTHIISDVTWFKSVKELEDSLVMNE